MSHVEHGDRTYGAGNIKVFQWGEGAKCKIGKFCSIAENVKIFLGGDHKVNWVTTFPFNKETSTHGDIIIGNDVWISHGVTIMSGVKIGDGAIVAANSHVVKDVEPYTIVGGNPAKYIRHRFDERIIESLMELKWWDLPANVITEMQDGLCSEPDYDTIQTWIQKYSKNN